MKLQSLILIIEKQVCQDWNIKKDIKVVEFIFFFMLYEDIKKRFSFKKNNYSRHFFLFNNIIKNYTKKIWFILINFYSNKNMKIDLSSVTLAK